MAIATATALLVGTGVSLLSSIFGGKSKERAAKQAASTQAAAADRSTALTREIYEQGREDLSPYREMGTEAMQMLSDFMGIATPGREPSDKFGSLTKRFSGEDLVNTPGYKFRLGQGLDAIERRGSARGKLLSGETDKDLIDYGQGLASTEFEAAYNRFRTDQTDTYSRLFGLSEAGRGATITGANLGSQAGRDISGNINLAGGARASGVFNAGQARASIYSGINQSVQSGVGNVMFDRYLNRQPVNQQFSPQSLPQSASQFSLNPGFSTSATRLAGGL